MLVKITMLLISKVSMNCYDGVLLLNIVSWDFHCTQLLHVIVFDVKSCDGER